MTPDELKAIQAPFKQRYRDDAAAAVCEMSATGIVDPEHLRCRVEQPPCNPWDEGAGLHPMAGGSETSV